MTLSALTARRGEGTPPMSFRASAHTGVGIRLSSPPSAREVSARSADGGREATRFSLPQSAVPTAPSQRGPHSAAAPRPCHSEPVLTLAWESVSPHLPLRGRCQRETLTEGERSRAFLSPSRLRRQPPPRGGLTARRAAPWQSVPLPQISVRITTIPYRILCTSPKFEFFAGNGCGWYSKVLYLTHTS